MTKGQAVAVSDGSFMKGAGASAWTIEGINKEGWCVSTSLTPGDPMDQSKCLQKQTDQIIQHIFTAKIHI